MSDEIPIRYRVEFWNATARGWRQAPYTWVFTAEPEAQIVLRVKRECNPTLKFRIAAVPDGDSPGAAT